MAEICEHLQAVDEQALRRPPRVQVCEECVKTGARWVHLRECLECGHVGCCDSSPNHHATRHFHATRHPVIRSAETGEAWLWCYPDEEFVELPPEDEVRPAQPRHDDAWGATQE